MSRRPAALALALVAALALVWAAAGGAEVVQKGNVRLTVDGGLSPSGLPRSGAAPIAVTVGGKVATTDGSRPPQLKSMTVELNRNGRIDSTGLPVCPLDSIQPGSSSRALNACRTSLVGRGSFNAEISLGGQEPYPIKGQLLAFNGLRGGKPVIYAHIYAPHPFATSFVIVFSISKGKGRFGSVLNAHLPASLGTWGNLTGIELRLSRHYSYRGHSRSYLTAGCPAPKGVSSVSFVLARTSFAFEGGHSLSSSLNRTCHALGH